MKIGLVCPTNIELMPYTRYYTEILHENNIAYEFIVWNRKLYDYNGRNNIHTYNRGIDDSASKIIKLIEYYKYCNYVKKIIDKEKYDKIIIFTLQPTIFLKKYMIKNFKNNYILDIRDYSYSINIEKLVKESRFTTISSPAYKEWLPRTNKYIVSHNMSKYDLNNYKCRENTKKNKRIKVSTIGALRDFEFNKQVIDQLANNDRFNLEFVGSGISESDLKLYCNNNNIKNVNFTGRYNKEEESDYYNDSTIINAYYTGKYKVNKSALPNRLYNSCLNNKPVIASDDIYLGKVVKQYKLGIVLNLDNDNLEELICNYINSDDYFDIQENSRIFLEDIQIDIVNFEDKVKAFLLK